MKLTLIAFVFALLFRLDGCSDPLGLAAAEHERTIAQVQTAQIQADAQTDQARISASTARVRVGGWMVGAMIAAVAAVAVAGIVGMTHLQAQRDRLSADAWRKQLPVIPPARALPTERPQAVHWLAITRPQRQQEPSHTLALPARSESTHDVVVIER